LSSQYFPKKQVLQFIEDFGKKVLMGIEKLRGMFLPEVDVMEADLPDFDPDEKTAEALGLYTKKGWEKRREELLKAKLP
jgi:hypothetical protein